MKSHILNSILETTSRSPSPEREPPSLTHYQEQAALRSETISAFHHAVTEDDEDDLLVAREKAKDELEKEEEEYAEFLRREVGQDLGSLVEVEKVEGGEDEVEEESVEEDQPKKKEKKKAKGKAKQEEDHEFLMKYVLILSRMIIY